MEICKQMKGCLKEHVVKDVDGVKHIMDQHGDFQKCLRIQKFAACLFLFVKTELTRHN